MDVCVITYRNTADRIRPALRPQDRLAVRDNTWDNIGFAKAANELAAEGDQDLILFINPDGDPAPGCFDALEQCFDEPDVVAAEASQGPNWSDVWGAERYTWLSGACLAVRRSAFEEVHAFDTSLLCTQKTSIFHGALQGLAGSSTVMRRSSSMTAADNHFGLCSTKAEMG